MAGFLKKIFGGNNGASEPRSQSPDEIYKDIAIRAAPMKEADGQFRIAGTLTREVDGVTEMRRFVRADLISGRDEALKLTVAKARQIIDQNGVSIWQGDPDHPV